MARSFSCHLLNMLAEVPDPRNKKGKRQATINGFKNIEEKYRVLRGGCWSDNGLFLKVSYRDWGPQHYTSVFRGFRCVKDKL